MTSADGTSFPKRDSVYLQSPGLSLSLGHSLDHISISYRIDNEIDAGERHKVDPICAGFYPS